MNYVIARHGAQLGEFSEAEIRDGIRDGLIQGTDLTWCAGMANWQPVSVVFGAGPASAPFPPPAYQAQPFAAQPYQAQPTGPAEGLATTSLVLGICSFIGSCLTGIPAVICGHVALSRMKRTGNRMGHGKAVAGLVLGYLSFGGVFVIAVLASLAVPTFSKVQEKAKQAQAINHARQIITSMRLYSADHDGNYPDKMENGAAVSDSNTAFRKLFISGMVEDESLFGCPQSPYNPDGNIGGPPDYREALQPGENHWAMTKGLTDSSPASYPLIYENTNPSADWPPTWNAMEAGRPVPGRAWPGGRIIVGMNDSSVSLMRLDSTSSPNAAPKVMSDGASWFPPQEPGMGVLNPR